MYNKRKIAATISAVIAAAVPLAACSDNGGTPTSGIALDPKDAIGVGAVSSVKLLSSAFPAQAIGMRAAIRNAQSDPTDADGAQADKFNEYFNALDGFLSGDIVSTETEANTDASIPFEIKMTVGGVDLNGDAVEYIMYYTETLEANDDDDDEDEIEAEYKLVGVMEVDGAQYALEGEREFEQDDEETENELKIRAYPDPDDKTAYVQMKQETSVEGNEIENKYVYTVVSAGQVVEKTSVKFEQEDNETTVKIEFLQGEAKGKYKVVRETSDKKTQIKVKYEINDKSGEFRIREIAGENGSVVYEYTFSDGSKKSFGKRSNG